MINKILSQVISILNKLQEAGYEGYIVGGCVRDLLMDRKPKDWDVTTNAKPEEITKIFPDSFYDNKFFTVGVKTDDEKVGVVEITTYRTETKYSDKRHPDEIKPAKTLEEDLKRRDFTMNAMAIGFEEQREKSKEKKYRSKIKIIDLFGGRGDIKNRTIRAVGDPSDRFSEDALRMLRAVRFHSELGFTIENETLQAIKKNAKNLQYIAKERIRDELTKIILSEKPAEGIEMLRETDLLTHVIPELEKGVGITQNRHHIYTIYEHGVLSLKHCPSKKLTVRLATLFHDIAKPQTKRGKGPNATFYNHDIVGSRIAAQILKRLRFPNKTIQQVKILIANHMFFYDPDEVTASSVRRLVRKVGPENTRDLIDLRVGDRLGSGVPKAKPYRLRHLEYMIEKVAKDPISVKMLEIDGNDLIKEVGLDPGPKIGAVLDVLLAEVIEDPSKNKRSDLLKRAKFLAKEDVSQLRELAKERIEEKKEEEDKEIKRRYWVR